MDTLPLELLRQILLHLPKTSLPSIRLLNHVFESLAFPLLFRNILSWLDYKTSHTAILAALANDAYARPSMMWSPWASEPKGPVQGVWLGFVWRLQMKVALRCEGVIGEGSAEEREKLTPENYTTLSGRPDMTERLLRVAQNRYLMHRSYCNGTLKEGVSENVEEMFVRRCS